MTDINTIERKSWNFGHFGTRHDGTIWNLVRIKSEAGVATPEETVVASNTSATPLVALARTMNTTEKRDIKITKLRQQMFLLAAELNELTDARDVAGATAILDSEPTAPAVEEEPPAPAVEVVVLSGKALKARAKELGIKGRGKMSAADLRTAVAAA